MSATMQAAAQPRPALIRYGSKLRPAVDRVIARSSRLPNDPVLSPELFGWVPALEAGWAAIREEALAVLAHRDAIPPLREISPDHQRIAGDGKWRSFFLYGYGHRAEENCRRAPRTASLVSMLPRLNSAFFSILDPGAHIPRHRGVTKGIFTTHLGLVVPKPAGRCRMQVGPHTVSWEEGKCLIFDDTWPHEVWNDTDGTRVVLLIQLMRPTGFPGNLVQSMFMGAISRSAFVTDAQANLEKWEEAYRALEATR